MCSIRNNKMLNVSHDTHITKYISNMCITNVFVINIRKDLLKKITYIFDFFNQSKINIERIEGVDSMKLYNNDKLFFNKLIINNDLSLNGYGFRKCKEEVIGEIGCFLAHKKCWKKIVNNKQKNTLILEDGIIFHIDKFVESIINNHSEVINENFDIIFINKDMYKIGISCNTQDPCITQDPCNIQELNKLCGNGTQGYILSYNGALKLLSKLNTLMMPVDLQIRQLCNNNELIWEVSNIYFCERNNERKSTISNKISNTSNVNDKQNFDNIITRIINTMLLNKIDVSIYL